MLPTNAQSIYNIVGGVAELTGLSVSPAGAGYRLRVQGLGAPLAYSDSFDIAP